MDKVIVLIVYVDDMVVTGNDSSEITTLQKHLAIEDLDHLKYFLGIKVARLTQSISLCQWKYVVDMLIEIDMLNCKPSETPI